MKTAVITGASSGIGREFALRISERYSLDEIWLIARREDRLRETASQIKTRTKIMPLDLSKEESLGEIKNALAEEKPEICMLVNAAGFGKFGTLESQSERDAMDMINVNIRALTAVTRMCADYMASGGGIINMASISGFMPLPYLNVYSATKAYVLHFTEALSEELKDKNISVTAVCPYWVASEFIPVAQDAEEGDSINNFFLITYPYSVVNKALRDNSRAKMLSLDGAAPHFIKTASRLMPVKTVFAVWNNIRKVNTSRYSQQSPELSRSRGQADRFHRTGTQRPSHW